MKLTKLAPYAAAFALFASGCAGLQPKHAQSGKNPYNEGWENAYMEHQNFKYKEGDYYTNTFKAAKNCDIESYRKFKEKASENVYTTGPDRAELEVKSALLLCSRELEWMFKDRTPEEEKLVKYGLGQVRDYRVGWSLKNDVLLCEFLAKDKPKEALKIADKILAGWSLDSMCRHFVERVMLDKAFILIKTKKDYKTAFKLYNEIYQIKQKGYVDDYISEMLDVLREYMPEEDSKND
jgi:hypothetical protein